MLSERDVRLEKIQKLIDIGKGPYAKTTGRDTSIGDALHSFDAWSRDEKVLVFAGRLMTKRVHGGMLFADLTDQSGKIQIALRRYDIGGDLFDEFRDLVDPGDIIEVSGKLFSTKRGEKSVAVSTWNMLAKAIAPLPEKWHGLQDKEKRFRQRELDLISNPEVKRIFIIRSKLIASLRQFLNERDFLEVETPVLQPIPGGANARPFSTHHNVLDIDLYLRIAPELYLKRLLVGGFEKIYEIARCFRNEGIDYAHNPEFTLIELYWAYVGKKRFISFMEDMLVYIIKRSLGTTTVEGEHGTLKFEAPFPRVTFRQAIIDACGIDIDEHLEPESLEKAVKQAGLDISFVNAVGIGEYYDELYKKTARPSLMGPTWVFDYPVEMKPLASRSVEDPRKSAVTQLIIGGAEIINAYYHELHDPIEQRKRFMEQQALVDEGSEEAQKMDEGFLEALEHGMPPAAGLGMGLDRLTAILTGAHSLKEVILFPTLRPQKTGAADTVETEEHTKSANDTENVTPQS